VRSKFYFRANYDAWSYVDGFLYVEKLQKSNYFKGYRTCEIIGGLQVEISTPLEA